jgi:predicted ArsR family transcriptional regulator
MACDAEESASSGEHSGTRLEVLALIVADGPITATDIADRLQLAVAGIRRHLGVLLDDGLIEARDRPRPGTRGRGRPARFFTATVRAHAAFESAATDLAVQALGYLKTTAGADRLTEFAEDRATQFEQRYAAEVAAAGTSVDARARALVAGLTRDGYAATLRPGPTGVSLQLCQGHCPVHEIAAHFPELCEAETRAISRLLGVYVQRLATLAQGEHVCTTCVPTP